MATKKTTQTQKSRSTGNSSKKSGSTTTKKTTSGKSGNSRKPAHAPEPPARQPIRREVGGVVCLILALLFFIGYFPVDALFSG